MGEVGNIKETVAIDSTGWCVRVKCHVIAWFVSVNWRNTVE